MHIHRYWPQVVACAGNICGVASKRHHLQAHHVCSLGIGLTISFLPTVFLACFFFPKHLRARYNLAISKTLLCFRLLFLLLLFLQFFGLATFGTGSYLSRNENHLKILCNLGWTRSRFLVWVCVCVCCRRTLMRQGKARTLFG